MGAKYAVRHEYTPTHHYLAPIVIPIKAIYLFHHGGLTFGCRKYPIRSQSKLVTSLVVLSVYIATRIHMHRLFVSHTCPVCSRCGRPIAYCEVGKREDGKAIAC